MTFLNATNDHFSYPFAIATGIVDATATLSPLLWAMVIVLLLCVVGIAADRHRHGRTQRRDSALVSRIPAWKAHGDWSMERTWPTTSLIERRSPSRGARGSASPLVGTTGRQGATTNRAQIAPRRARTGRASVAGTIEAGGSRRAASPSYSGQDFSTLRQRRLSPGMLSLVFTSRVSPFGIGNSMD
jgi:hypothetical protein